MMVLAVALVAPVLLCWAAMAWSYWYVGRAFNRPERNLDTLGRSCRALLPPS